MFFIIEVEDSSTHTWCATIFRFLCILIQTLISPSHCNFWLRSCWQQQDSRWGRKGLLVWSKFVTWSQKAVTLYWAELCAQKSHSTCWFSWSILCVMLMLFCTELQLFSCYRKWQLWRHAVCTAVICDVLFDQLFCSRKRSHVWGQALCTEYWLVIRVILIQRFATSPVAQKAVSLKHGHMYIVFFVKCWWACLRVFCRILLSFQKWLSQIGFQWSLLLWKKKWQQWATCQSYLKRHARAVWGPLESYHPLNLTMLLCLLFCDLPRMSSICHNWNRNGPAANTPPQHWEWRLDGVAMLKDRKSQTQPVSYTKHPELSHTSADCWAENYVFPYTFNGSGGIHIDMYAVAFFDFI